MVQDREGVHRKKIISTDMATNVSALYDDEGIVCPISLQTAAVESLDNNPISYTAKRPVHQTAISLTNHLSSTTPGIKRDITHQTP